MRKSTTIFLQAVIAIIGIGVLVFLLWEPHLEGVNANATSLSQIYLDDPFLAYVYAASIAFFTGLYQVFKLLGYIGENNMVSKVSAKALRTIKYCASILVLCILGAEAYIFLVIRGTDDIAGGVMMGLFLLVISAIVGITAAVFEKSLQNAMKLKS